MESKNVKKKAEPKEVTPLKPEESVVIVGCLNSEVIKEIAKVASKNAVQLVRLDDKVVFDYLEKKGVKVSNGEQITLDKFLSDEKNKQSAQEQAEKLFTILTKSTEVEKDSDAEFTEKEVCQKTNLSHSKANALFNLLRAFGFFEWTDLKRKAFKLHFSDDFKKSAIRNDIIAQIKVINHDILRYKKVVESIPRIKKEKVEKEMSEVWDLFTANIEL